MLTEVFKQPDLEAMDNAHLDGLLNWHRRDRTNPYEVAQEIVSDGMWYAWDSGRRLGVFLNEVRTAALMTESDRVNAATLRKLKATEDPRQAARFGLFGGRT